MIDGTLYDGVTAYPHPVRVSVAGGRLELSQEAGWSDSIEPAVLVRLEASPSTLRLGRADMPGWRLLISAESSGEIEPLLARPERYGRWVDRLGLWPAVLAFGAITASVLTIGYLAPQWIAPAVPESWERNLGDALVGDFGENRCRNAEGQRALEALVERLEPGATRGPDAIRIAAIDYPIFNAAALPGGHIIVFHGALTGTRNADELAGIVAHEIAHVRRRHITESLIRELGIGALIRLFAGGLGANAEQLVALSYTREAETEADGDAIRMLRRAGISPAPTADLFRRFSKHEGGAFSEAEFFSSHPLTKGRAERFAAAYDPKARYSPALPQEQSDALFNVCLPAGP